MRFAEIYKRTNGRQFAFLSGVNDISQRRPTE